MGTRIITTRQRFLSLLFQSYSSLSIRSSYVSCVYRRISTATSALRCYYSHQAKILSLDNFKAENILPEKTNLFDEHSNEHWLIAMDIDRTNFPRKKHVIDHYIQTLATVVGSEEESRKKIYSVHTRGFYAFGALISKELARKMRCLEKVLLVIPVSYQDVINNVHGGEPFANDHDMFYKLRYQKKLNYLELMLWLRCETDRERKRLFDIACNYDGYVYDIYSRNIKTRIDNMQLQQRGIMLKYVRGWPIGSNYSDDYDVENYFQGWRNEGIQIGDYVNLLSLLYTKNRDYSLNTMNPNWYVYVKYYYTWHNQYD